MKQSEAVRQAFIDEATRLNPPQPNIHDDALDKCARIAAWCYGTIIAVFLALCVRIVCRMFL